MKTPDSKISFWPYLGILFLLFIFYPGLFLAKGAWLVSDHAEQHFPWANYLAERIKAGSLPFWTDLIQTGFPVTAEGQIGTFYLPNLLFYAFLPIRQGYAWNIIFHLIFSGFFTYRYLISLKLSEKSAFFGTLVYLFGSTLGGAYYNITSLKVLTWFPLSLIVIDQWIQSESIKWGKVLLLGFIFSLEILAGYQQYATYAILFAFLYLLFRYLESFSLKKILPLAVAAGVSLLVCVMISWPQLALMFQLALHSNRVNLQESFAYIGSYPPFALVCLLFPSLESLFASKLYLGIIPLFFAAIGFASWPKKSERTIFILFGIAILLALGGYNPLYVFMVKILKFYSFRTPVKFIFFAGFFLAVISAFGMERLLNNLDQKQIKRGAAIFFTVLGMALAGVLASYFLFRYGRQPIYRLGEWIVNRFIYGKPGHPYDWSHYQAKLTDYVSNAQALLNPFGEVIAIPLLKIVGVVTLVLLFLKKRFRLTVFYWLSVLFLILDLYAYSFADIQRDYTSYSQFFQESGIVKFLKENLGEYQYFNYSNTPGDAPLPAAKNMIYGLRSANAYSPLVFKDYYDFFSKAGGVNDSTGNQLIDNQYLYAHLKQLGMLGVKYIVSDEWLDSPDLKPVYRENKWSVFENPFAMPHCVFVPEFKVFKGRQDLWAFLQSKEFDPGQLILLESEPQFKGTKDERMDQDSIKITKETPEKIQLQVTSKKDQMLMIGQTFYPGWTAAVDGKQAEILRVNGIICGIPLSQGFHEIELKYSFLEGIKQIKRKSK